jgi:hypothetical protein
MCPIFCSLRSQALTRKCFNCGAPPPSQLQPAPSQGLTTPYLRITDEGAAQPEEVRPPAGKMPLLLAPTVSENAPSTRARRPPAEPDGSASLAPARTPGRPTQATGLATASRPQQRVTKPGTTTVDNVERALQEASRTPSDCNLRCLVAGQCPQQPRREQRTAAAPARPLSSAWPSQPPNRCTSPRRTNDPPQEHMARTVEIT